jgi:hypothetical protein
MTSTATSAKNNFSSMKNLEKSCSSNNDDSNDDEEEEEEEEEEETEEELNTNPDPILGLIGDVGKYQILMCLIIALFEVKKNFFNITKNYPKKNYFDYSFI